MSGFYGVFSPGQKVDATAFGQMSKYAYSDAFDAVEVHQSDHVAMGHLMLRTSPEAEYDKQPLKSSCENYILVGHFRLDYRDELGDKLGLTYAELKGIPDSVLVMKAFQKWKETCVNHIEGDWAFALYDQAESNLFLAKDKTGVSALFHIRVGDQVYFASTTTTILAIQNQHFEIDQDTFLKYTRLDYYPTGGETLIRELFYVNNGEYVSYDPVLKKKSFTYWTLRDLPEVRYRHEEDHVYALFSVYTDAVRSRLRSDQKIGIFLSGGLDSSSVAALAASELKIAHRNLYSFTSFPRFEDALPVSENIMVNEVPLVKELVKQYDNIHPAYLDFPDFSLKDQFTSEQVKDAYFPIVSKNSFWINGIMQEARNKGVRRMLTGQMGNFTVTWTNPNLYADLLYQFRFAELYTRIKSDRAFSNKGLFSFVFDYVLRPAKAKFWNVFLSNNEREVRRIYLDLASRYSKLDLFPKHFQVNEQNKFYKLFQESKRKRNNHLKKIIPYSGIKWSIESSGNCEEVTDPTADCRLVCHVNSLPSDVFFKSGIKKFIFKIMMEKLLPENLIHSAKIGVQSVDFNIRMKKDFQSESFSKSHFVSGTSSIGKEKEIIKLYEELILKPKSFVKDLGLSYFLRFFSLIVFSDRKLNLHMNIKEQLGKEKNI